MATDIFSSVGEIDYFLGVGAHMSTTRCEKNHELPNQEFTTEINLVTIEFNIIRQIWWRLMKHLFIDLVLATAPSHWSSSIIPSGSGVI